MEGRVPESRQAWTNRQVVSGTLLAVTLIASLYLLAQLWLVAFIFFFGIVASLAVRPGVLWLGAHGFSRKQAGIVVFAAALLLAVAAVTLALPPLLSQTAALYPYLEHIYSTFLSWLLSPHNRLFWRLGARLPSFSSLLGDAPGAEAERVVQIARYAALTVRGIAVVIFVILIGLFWTVEGERATRSILLLLPRPQRPVAQSLFQTVEAKLGAFLRGEALLMSAVGTLSFLAYQLIGLPYAFGLAILAGLTEAIPVLGPILGALPALALALSVDPARVPWVALSAVLIQLLENNLLLPRVMRAALGVNPFVTLIAVASFGLLFGPIGVFAAIPLAAVIQVVLDQAVFRTEATDVPEPTGRDRVSALRYEARELLRDVRGRIRNLEETPGDGESIEDALEATILDLDQALLTAEIGRGGGEP